MSLKINAEDSGKRALAAMLRAAADWILETNQRLTVDLEVTFHEVKKAKA